MKQEQNLTKLILWSRKQVRVAFGIGRKSGHWKHLLPRRHFRAGVLGQKARLVCRAVMASFSHESWAASPGQLGHCLVSNLVFGPEEGAVPFQEREREDSLEKQPQHQAIEQGHSPVGLGDLGTWESLAETLVLHLQTVAHLLQELLLHHSSV